MEESKSQVKFQEPGFSIFISACGENQENAAFLLCVTFSYPELSSVFSIINFA